MEKNKRQPNTFKPYSYFSMVSEPGSLWPVLAFFLQFKCSPPPLKRGGGGVKKIISHIYSFTFRSPYTYPSYLSIPKHIFFILPLNIVSCRAQPSVWSSPGGNLAQRPQIGPWPNFCICTSRSSTTTDHDQYSRHYCPSHPTSTGSFDFYHWCFSDSSHKLSFGPQMHSLWWKQTYSCWLLRIDWLPGLVGPLQSSAQE